MPTPKSGRPPKKRLGVMIRPISADIGTERMAEIHDLACRRTAWVLAELPRLNWSVRSALVQAYVQGMCDTLETVEARTEIRWPPECDV